jgi:hypothetical protein
LQNLLLLVAELAQPVVQQGLDLARLQQGSSGSIRLSSAMASPIV